MADEKHLTWRFEPLDPSIDRTKIDPGSLEISRDELLRLYRAMRLARTFETKLASLYRQGKIVGAVFLGMGQEAIAAGVVSLLGQDDVFSTVARNLAGWFHRGVEPRHVMARWRGKDIAPSHGRRYRCFRRCFPNYTWVPRGVR